MSGTRKVKFSRANKDAVNTLALELNLSSKEICVGNVKGEDYYIVPASKNVICEGVILFLQSKDIEIKRSSQNERDVFLVPIKPIKKYLEYFGDKNKTIETQTRYVCLYDCFTQLLSKHLTPDQYEFRGGYLLIRKTREETTFLEALFKHEKFKDCVYVADEGLHISFDFLAEFGLVELDALFAELSTKDQRIVWSNEHFPMCYLAERLNNLPDPEDRFTRYLCIDISSSIVNTTDEPVIRIPDKYFTSKLLSHFLLMQGFPGLVFQESLYLFRRNVMELFPSVHETEFERKAKEFIATQKQIIHKVCETKVLSCGHYQDNLLICHSAGKNVSQADSTIGAFELKYITLDTIDLLISMCLKLVFIKNRLEQCSNYFSSSFGDRKLIVTSTYGIQTKSLTQFAGGKVVASAGKVFTYTIDLLSMRNVEDTHLLLLITEMEIINFREDLRDELNDKIKSVIQSNNVMVKMEGLFFTFTIPDSLKEIMQPLCSAVSAEFNVANNKYTARVMAVDRLLHSDVKDGVFAEVAERYTAQVAAERKHVEDIRAANANRNKKKKLKRNQRKQKLQPPPELVQETPAAPAAVGMFARTNFKEIADEINSAVTYLQKLFAQLEYIFESIEYICINDITLKQLIHTPELQQYTRAYALFITIEDLSDIQQMLTTEMTFDEQTIDLLNRCSKAMQEPCTLEMLKEICDVTCNALKTLK